MHGTNKLGLGSPLARRLILWVVLFSSAVTLLLTALQLYRNYRLDLNAIDEQFRQIERAHVPSLIENVWATDHDAVQLQLDGLLALRDVRYLEIEDDAGAIIHAGEPTSDNVVAREFPLRYRHRDQDRYIGRLKAVITLEGVYRRLVDTAVVVLVSNAVKTFLVTGFMLLLFHRLVGRYLSGIARRAESITLDNLDDSIESERANRRERAPDEIDALATALDRMRRGLRESRDALAASERRYRSLFEQAQDGIVIAEPATGRILDANPSMATLTGYSRAELLGTTLIELAPPDARADTEATLRRAVATGQALFERFLRHKDGHAIPVEVSVRVVDLTEQSVVMGVVYDMSARRRAEYEIDESRHKLESVVTSAPVVLWAVDRDGVFTLSEGKGLRQLGLVPGEVIGRSVFDVYRDHPNVLAHVQRALAGESFIAEVNVATLWFEVHYAPARDHQGRSIGAMGVAVDITERRHAEQSLRAERDFSSAVLETVGSMVVVLDRAGRIVRFNRACERLTGYRFDEIKGRSIWEFLIPAEQIAGVKDAFADLTSASRSGHYENDWLTRTGERRLIAWSNTNLFAPDGGVEFVIATGVDITERRHTEAERERLLAELQARNAEMESFLYTVSHDLKNPLITIGGFASLLDRDIAAGKLELAQDSIAEINKAVQSLKQHIKDMLSLSRAGRVIADKRPVRLAGLVADVIAAMRARIEAAGATISVAPDLPGALVNEEGFHRVYTNLIDNAIKYRRAGAAPHIDIGWRRDGTTLRLFVRDNGMGIKSRYHERVFELFQRLDSHTEGTGVGLAISKRVVEAHGGSMWVESHFGRGSTFWISLPESVIVRDAVHPYGLDASSG